MPFLAQGKTNWKFLIIVVVLAAIVGGVALWCLNNWKLGDEVSIQKSDLILFKKDESWGPCPPNSICSQITKLYDSGKLIMEGEKNIEKQLDKEIIEKIKAQIKSSGIMDKECSGEFPLLDYSVDYTLNFEGKIKKIRLPNCEQELKLIENIIKGETADCLRKYPAVTFEDCVPGEVVDGWQGIILYPNTLDTSSVEHYIDAPAPDIVKQAGIARYETSRSTCQTTWYIKINGEWKDVNQLDFCNFIIEYNSSCNNCLLEWEEGCC